MQFPQAPESRVLAPLQCRMLATSMADSHVEQVVLRLSGRVTAAQAIVAWGEMVKQTEALQIHFQGRESWDWNSEPPLLRVMDGLPADWEGWLAEDRAQQLVLPETVPWRAVFWPADGCLVWTFHHALLDGRSMVKILGSFLDRVAGQPTERLRLARWVQPSADECALAKAMYQKQFAGLKWVGETPLMLNGSTTKARKCLGSDFQNQLACTKTTAATQVIWAWGQALLERSGADSVVVEQVRAGAPQPGTAGFTMNLLPVLIRHARDETLQEFRLRLLALREVERISWIDFTSFYPEDCSVIMVEHGTLQHQVGREEFVKSIRLHEPVVEVSTATAYLLPDAVLEVEGSNRRLLLDAWVRSLEGLRADSAAS